jgi:hypothetical protein
MQTIMPNNLQKGEEIDVRDYKKRLSQRVLKKFRLYLVDISLRAQL